MWCRIGVSTQPAPPLRIAFLVSVAVGAAAEVLSVSPSSFLSPSCSFGGRWLEPGDIPVSDSQRLAAQQVVANTKSGGLVSDARKLATVELAMKALEVEGDFVETGVYNGGTAILMGKVLLPHAVNHAPPAPNLWLADSFEGLPKEDPDHHPSPQGLRGNKVGGLQAASENIGTQGQFAFARVSFDDNLRSFGMFNHANIKVLQGWFKDTLPKAPIDSIAFLRLDGDIFASTMDSLTALYDKVVPNGYIYVDDYGAFKGCKDAIDSFRSSHNIHDQMFPIEEGAGSYEAVWWRKT